MSGHPKVANEQGKCLGVHLANAHSGVDWKRVKQQRKQQILARQIRAGHDAQASRALQIENQRRRQAHQPDASGVLRHRQALSHYFHIILLQRTISFKRSKEVRSKCTYSD